MVAARASFRLVTPDDPTGLAVAGVLLFARMAFAATLLYLYHRLARAGFPAFAVALAGGFSIAYFAELARFARIVPRAGRRHA